ncbi:MAG: GTP-binding protein, partial [Christensenellaceae bacterium]|nr:GTP-binding protein [Christensenellaceae bacterium]
QDAGIEVTEMNSGCICCSLVGDFGEALKKVLEQYAPDRILIEPSGVGKLSDVIKAVKDIHAHDLVLNSYTTIVDANKCKMYMKNFGEFFNNQVEHANCIVLSRTDGMNEDKLHKCIELLRGVNEKSTIITTPWDQLTGAQILDAMEHKNTLEAELHEMEHHHHEHHHHDEKCSCGHHHDHEHHRHDEECSCDHHHDHEHHHHDEECSCDHHHDHEHHHHDEECSCGHHHDHEHHHHDEECSCGHHHDHEHHHHDGECSCGHHHADDVFVSWGCETINKYSVGQIENILDELLDESKYGTVLRAKGIVASENGEWIHFDYVPGEADVRTGTAIVMGRLCVIGADLKEDALKALFGA